MRLWSIHPSALDSRGLVALWREGLLARAVLRGRTRGYRQHPQLIRFRECERPVASINSYLAAVHDEATRRGYQFNRALLGRARCDDVINVSSGQLAFEWEHLLSKLLHRDRDAYARACELVNPPVHSLFRIVNGPVAGWEVRR